MKRGPTMLWFVAMALFSKEIFSQAAGQQSPLLTPSARIESPAQATRLTLHDALRLAEESNPALLAALAGIQAAEGQLTDTRGLLWNNPQVSTDQIRRRAPLPSGIEQTFPEWTLGFSQTFEIAGQQGYRRQAAELDLAATRENIGEIRRRVRAEVELRFTRVLILQNRIDIEREALEIVENSAAVVRKRVAAGEDSRLDGNLASVEAERGRNQFTVLQEQLIDARSELAASLQLPPTNLPEAIGVAEVTPATYTLEFLLAEAANRPQLRSLDFREQAARNRLALERASVYPDITVGLTRGRDGPGDARERFNMLSLSVPLPLFKRNAAGIGRATTELAQSQIERETAARDIQAQVRTLWLRLDSLRARVKRLSDSVLPSLTENRRLSTASYRAGEIGLLQLLVVNRQLVDARRDYLDALAEFVQTRIALEQAAGGSVNAGAK
jgi:cobalt-zinc-cadmium efflux system outer membrane protein